MEQLSETDCRKTLDYDGPLCVADAAAEGWEGDPAYERFGLGSYLGATLVVDGERYGTPCFADTRSRDRQFTGAETTFIALLREWVTGRRYRPRPGSAGSPPRHSSPR